MCAEDLIKNESNLMQTFEMSLCFSYFGFEKYLKLNQYCSIKFWIVRISIQNSELKFG